MTTSSRLRNITIQRKLVLVSRAVLAAYAIICAFQIAAVERYKVGGPIYGTVKAQSDALDVLSGLVSDVHALQATLHSVSPTPSSDEVQQLRTRAEEYGEGIGARFSRVRAIDGLEVGELVANAESTWSAYFSALQEQLRTFNRSNFQTFLEGPQGRRYARLAGEVEEANNALRLRASRLEKETSATVMVTHIVMVSFEVLLGVGLILVLRIISRSITEPLHGLVEAAQRVGDGDLSVQLPASSQDELGQLGASLGRMVVQLRQMVQSFRQVALQLAETVQNMAAVATEQGLSVNRQGAAVRETQITAQQIRQTSKTAAARAARLLQAAEKAGEVGRAGGTALKASLEGIESIKTGIDEIAERMRKLGDRAQHLGMITETVKDLTDQNQVLALSASIEAVRSGEHGKGFAIVAREMRALTEQSAGATKQIKLELEATSSALKESVEITQHGKASMERGLEQIELSSERLQELAVMVEESATGVREIATAVSQQDEGVAQIFTAVTDLTTTVGDSEASIQGIREAITLLEKVSAEVKTAAELFRV